MLSVDDFQSFVFYSYEPNIGEDNAFAYPGLILEKECTSRYSSNDYSAFVTYHREAGCFSSNALRNQELC
jgi:hypothetical protein